MQRRTKVFRTQNETKCASLMNLDVKYSHVPEVNRLPKSKS